MKYLLWINEQGEGPYDKSQIVEMLSSGKITGQTECLPEGGSGDWLPVRSITGLLVGGGPRSRRRNAPLWIGAGILVLITFLWLLEHRTKHRVPGPEKEQARAELTVPAADPVGDPYVGAIKIRISSMGQTVDLSTPNNGLPLLHPDPGVDDVTNSTLIEFEVTSESDAFISHFTKEAQFLDSWGKVIAECFFQVRDIKPHGRSVGNAIVNNLPREKLNGWRLHPEFPAPWPAKWISWHTVSIQWVEGSNTLAAVTAEVW